jgi:hypothetical protein
MFPDDTRCRAGLRCDRIIEKLCNMLLTLGAYNSGCSNDGNTRYVILVDVVQTLMCFDD